MAALPKRPKGVLSKGMGASNFVPGPYSKTGKDKFQDVVMAAMDTTETQKDRANIKSIIYSAGRKYKVDAAVVQKAAKAAEKMYAKKKPASKSADGSDTKPYNVRLIKPSEIIKDKPAVKKVAAKKATVKKTAVKPMIKKAGKK
jgi:hypothetical protein